MKARWTCEGDVRGSCGVMHLSTTAAQACCARDQNAAKRQGGYSDRAVVPFNDAASDFDRRKEAREEISHAEDRIRVAERDCEPETYIADLRIELKHWHAIFDGDNNDSDDPVFYVDAEIAVYSGSTEIGRAKVWAGTPLGGWWPASGLSHRNDGTGEHGYFTEFEEREEDEWYLDGATTHDKNGIVLEDFGLTEETIDRLNKDLKVCLRDLRAAADDYAARMSLIIEGGSHGA
jgi:hypothetical protein